MTKVFIARHPTEAHLLKSLLELEGISAEVRGEALYGALGEIPIDSNSLPSVWIQDGSQFDKAMEFVRGYVSGQGSPDSTGKSWHCPKCGEMMESQFTSCWNCGTDHDQKNIDNKAFKSSEMNTDDRLGHRIININVLYRYTVISSFVLFTIWFFMPYFWQSIYDQNTLDLLSWNGYGGLLGNHTWLAYSFLLLYYFTYWGLINFKPLARLIFLVLVFVSFITASFNGIVVQTASGYFLDSLLFFIDGLIITLMYFTDLSNEFLKKDNH